MNLALAFALFLGWTLVAVLLGCVIGSSVRMADERTPELTETVERLDVLA